MTGTNQEDGYCDTSEEDQWIKTSTNQEEPSYCVLAFYQFFREPFSKRDPQQWRLEMDATLRSYQARGAIRISVEEGMNGTICFPEKHQAAVLHYLQQQYDPPLAPLEGSSSLTTLRLRISHHSAPTFHRLSIRIKNEIVTMGPIPQDWISSPPREKPSSSERAVQNLRPQRTGIYIPPGPEWDALLHDPHCLVIDTRNDYEIAMGTFVNAVAPRTREFTEFPSWLRDQLSSQSSTTKPSQYNKIAMFCTGGIRCEKATALCIQMMDASTSDREEHCPLPVYHLEGGILAYLEKEGTDSSASSAFVGECFVFDQRVAVTYGLQPTAQYVLCHACRRPVHVRDTQETTTRYQFGVACPACVQENPGRARRRYVERQKQMELAQQRQVPHMYDAKEYC